MPSYTVVPKKLYWKYIINICIQWGVRNVHPAYWGMHTHGVEWLIEHYCWKYRHMWRMFHPCSRYVKWNHCCCNIHSHMSMISLNSYGCRTFTDVLGNGYAPLPVIQSEEYCCSHLALYLMRVCSGRKFRPHAELIHLPVLA